MKICLVVLAVLAVSFVTQCESKAFHFHPFRFDYKKEQTSTGYLKKLTFNGHHGKIFNFNSIFHHGAHASAPIESEPTTTTTEAPQTPKSTNGHGLKKHFNINWSYNFHHGPSAGNANFDSNSHAVVETVAVSTTEKSFEAEMKIEDFGTSFDTKVVDESFVEDSQDDAFSGNSDIGAVNDSINDPINDSVNETETGLISNEYLPPKY